MRAKLTDKYVLQLKDYFEVVLTIEVCTDVSWINYNGEQSATEQQTMLFWLHGHRSRSAKLLLSQI